MVARRIPARLRSTLVRGACLALLVGSPIPAEAWAQRERPELSVVWESGESDRRTLAMDRGYAALDIDLMVALGWSVDRDGDGARLSGPDGASVVVREGSPFFRWNDQSLQFTDPPYRDGSGGALMVPLQLLSDFLPRRLPDLYTFDGPALRFRSATGGRSDPATAVGPADPATSVERPAVAATVEPGAEADGAPPGGRETIARAVPQRRVVVIDAGHGGPDPGSISRSGLREKTVALGVALAMADRLRTRDDFEVHLIRDNDTFVPAWNRGPRANDLRGDRPGLFVSIHANSFDSPARGFETYFLSEARTEHERRVAAIENAPVRIDDTEVPSHDDLGFILRELRNFDHSHWSHLLAEYVQDAIAPLHPGPNRGVKQAPLAVLTNALMPAVLVEVGFLSHPDEARLLAREDFQRDTGSAIAEAVIRFFERYPPGSGTGAGERP